MPSENAKSLGYLMLLIIGLLSTVLYIASTLYVSINPIYLWIGIFLVSSMLVLILFQRSERIFIPCLFLVALFLVSWELIRFRGWFGSDIFGEIEVAEYTSVYGWTNYLVSHHMYATSLSVTILPSVISRVTGIPVKEVFSIVFPFFSALIPVLLYLLIRNVVGSEKVAGLSSIIYVFDYASLTGLTNLMRQNIADIFLILTICMLYVRYRKSHSKATLSAIICMFIAGIITAHYTSAFFFLFLLICLGVLSYAQKMKVFLSSNLILFSIVATFAWLVFVAYITFVVGVTSGYDVALKLLYGGGSAHSYASYAATSPRGGTFSSIVIFVYRVLIVFGMVICLIKYKDFPTRMFASLGLSMFGLLGAWTLIPQISKLVYLDRVYGLGLIFFSFFEATSLLWISMLATNQLSRFKAFQIAKIKVAIGSLIVYFFIFVFLFNSILMMPVFYYMPMSYSSTDEVVAQPLFKENDVAFTRWLESYSSIDQLFVGDLRSIETWNRFVELDWKWKSSSAIGIIGYFDLANFRGKTSIQYTFLLDETFKTNRIVWHDIEPVPNATIALLPSGRVTIHYNNLNLEQAFTSRPGANLVYNNGRDFLFYSNFTWNPLKG